MNRRLIFLTIFLMGIGNLSADVKVYVEKNLVNEGKKEQLIDLIYKIKSHFDSEGGDFKTQQSMQDWHNLSSQAKQLNLFVITDKNSFICLNNKHKKI
jgi:uncharacterized protein YycO